MSLARLCPGLTLRWTALGRQVSILPAMNTSRHKIAAGVTVLALGALATVALAAGGPEQRSPSAASASAVTQPAAEVRTEIIRETIHRRAKRARGHHSTASAAGSGRSPVAARPVASSSAPRPAPAAVAPVGTPDAGRSRGNDDLASDDHCGRGGDDRGSDDHGGRGESGGHDEVETEVEDHGGDE
jgi:hypothetical protein